MSVRTGAQSQSRQAAVSTAACLQDDRRWLGAWLLRLGVNKSGLTGPRRGRPGAVAASAPAARQESCSRHNKFSKVLYIVTFFGKYTMALTFQNVCQGKSRNRSMLPDGADSRASATTQREEMKLDHLSSMLRSGQIQNSWGHGATSAAG